MTRMTKEAMRWSPKIKQSWGGSWNLWRLLKDVQVGAFPSLGRQYENNGFGFRWGILSSGYVIFAIEKVETQDNDAENGIHHIVDEEPGANSEVSGAGKTIALY